MEKEIKYIAPWAEILSAQVEKGFQSSPGSMPGTPDPGDHDIF